MSDKVKLRVDLSGKEDKTNKVTTLSSSSTNQQYPTAKTVYDAISELETGTGDYINDYYFDSTTKELVIDFTSDGSGGDTLDVSEFYIDTNTDEIVIVSDDESGGNDVDIATSWGQTLSNEKVPSEKLVKESIDSVLYTTEEVTLGTSSTSSNVSYTYNYNDTDLTLTIPTLNTCQFFLSEGFFSNVDKIGGFELIFEIVFPQTGDAMFKLGDDDGGVALFQTYDSYRWRRYFGYCNYRKEIEDVDMVYYYEYDDDLEQMVNKENITISIQTKGNTATIYFNDGSNNHLDISYNSSIQFSSNVSVNVYAKAPNFPIRLSKFFDDTKSIEELEDGTDLNNLSLDKTYVGYNGDWTILSNCPVQNKSFVLINRNITPTDSGDLPNLQQILMTMNDGANTELWIRYHYQTGDYTGTWVKLATGNVTIDSSWVANSTNPVQSQLIKSALDGKSDTAHTHSQYTNPQIADNLTTNDSTQVLSAKQGKILNDLIGNILTIINGTGT